MKNLLASLALLAVMCGSIVPAFADEAAAPAAATATASTAAPGTPAAAAPAADAPAATPKCGDKGFDCNKGDVAWMMTSTAFVLLMTVPGLALFYSGMVRRNPIIFANTDQSDLFSNIAGATIAERMRIHSNGNIGIGTTNPQAKLEITGQAALKVNCDVINYNNAEMSIAANFGAIDTDRVVIGSYYGSSAIGAKNNNLSQPRILYLNPGNNEKVIVGDMIITTNTNNFPYKFAVSGADAFIHNVRIGCGNSGDPTNSLFGLDALRYSTGAGNTAIGYAALGNNGTGSYNTAVGKGAGYNTNYNASTAIGYECMASADAQVRIGNQYISSIGGSVNWTTFSDSRIKKNIKPNVPGLEFINKLQPVTYNMDLDAAEKILHIPSVKDENSIMANLRKAKEQFVYSGFIAQDVEKAAKELNFDFSGVDAAKNDRDLYGLRYAEFVVPLVKSVQELSKKNDDLQKQIDELKDALIKVLANKTPCISIK